LKTRQGRDDRALRPVISPSLLHYLLSLKAIGLGYRLSDKLKILIDRLLLVTYPLNFYCYRHFGRTLLDPHKIISDYCCRLGNLVFHCPAGISDMQLSDNYEPSVKDLVSKVSIGDAVDVGANFGLFTILLSRRLGEHGTVLSFEPDPFYFKLLTSNIKMNKCRNVLPINAAAWSSNTKLGLMPHRLGGLGFETKVAESIDVSTVEIPARTVDEFLDEFDLKPKFVKIDVEGAEYQVLSGMAGSLRSDRPVVAFEALSRETLNKCCNFLKNLHYRVRQIDERNHVGLPETSPTPNEGHRVLFEG